MPSRGNILTQKGLATGNITPETRGAFNVREAFAELRVPLLADLPYAQALDLNLAARVSDYSTVGSTTAWAASIASNPSAIVKGSTPNGTLSVPSSSG